MSREKVTKKRTDFYFEKIVPNVSLEFGLGLGE